METRKQLILILMFFGYICYGQGNTRANAGVAYGSGINKNVENNSTQTFQLVGVDEANIAQKKLSFTTPLAKALLHKKAGDHGILDLGAKRSTFKILKIEYLILSIPSS